MCNKQFAKINKRIKNKCCAELCRSIGKGINKI